MYILVKLGSTRFPEISYLLSLFIRNHILGIGHPSCRPTVESGPANQDCTRYFLKFNDCPYCDGKYSGEELACYFVDFVGNQRPGLENCLEIRGTQPDF